MDGSKKGLNKYKRKNVEFLAAYISLMIFLLLFGLTALFLLFFPRSTKSEIEKRNLATFPQFSFESYFSGKFTADIATFYDDTVPFRDFFKTAGYNFKSVFGLNSLISINDEDDVKIVGKPKVVIKNPETSKPESSKPEETSSKPANQESSAPEESSQTSTPDKMGEAEYTEENGIIVVKHNGHYRALELFGGGTGNDYVKALNNFHKDLGSGVKIYSMTAPLASEFYTPSNYSGFTLNQKEHFDEIASRLDKDIVYVDIDTVLAQHTDEDIYFRTDHHWTPLGAYYAAQTFAQAAGVPFKDLSTYTPVDIEGFVGTMYAFTQDANINNDPELFRYYVPDNNDKCVTEYYDTSFNDPGTGNFFNGVGDPQHNAYLTFMGGDEQIVKVTTDVKNGRKLMIVKDSYGNSLPGYLFGSFEEIYIIDMRYCDVNLVNMIKENGITDLVFAMVAFSQVGPNSANLDKLRTQ